MTVNDSNGRILLCGVAAALFVLYYVLSLWGYGNDCDTYLMIRAGRNLLVNHEYFPSRPPGYLVPELVIGFTSLYGKFYVSNLVSALLGGSAIYVFWLLLRDSLDKTSAVLSCLIVGLNPHYIIAASSSMDYVYSIFFGLLSVLLLRRERYYLAALMAALCLSSRLSNGLIILVILGYLVFVHFKNGSRDKRARIAASALLGSGVTALLFAPSFIAYNYSFGFLTYTVPDWTFAERFYRVIYKNIYLVGLLPAVFGGLSGLYFATRRRKKISGTCLILASVIVILHEILFLKIPIDIAYLLPLLFVLVPLWVSLAGGRRPAAWIMLALTIVTIFVRTDFLRMDYGGADGEAVGARFELSVQRGRLISDLMQRERSRQSFFDKYGITDGP